MSINHDRLSLDKPYVLGTRKSNMESTEDVENETTDENILYDLTIHAEWKQENELFVRAIMIIPVCLQMAVILLNWAKSP